MIIGMFSVLECTLTASLVANSLVVHCLGNVPAEQPSSAGALHWHALFLWTPSEQKYGAVTMMLCSCPAAAWPTDTGSKSHYDAKLWAHSIAGCPASCCAQPTRRPARADHTRAHSRGGRDRHQPASGAAGLLRAPHRARAGRAGRERPRHHQGRRAQVPDHLPRAGARRARPAGCCCTPCTWWGC